MKQFFSKFSFFGLILIAIACGERDDTPRVEPTNVTIQTTYSDDFDNKPASSVTVSIRNTTSQQVFEGVTGADGTLLLESVPSGLYDITGTITMSSEAFFSFAGYLPDGDEVVFNANMTAVQINPNASSFVLELVSGRLGSLVIKQVYFAGSDRVDGAQFRDQFIEIFNNSTEVQYMDGLYIMGIAGRNSNTPADFTLPNGQWDWSKSVGMSATGDPNNDYVYPKWLFQFPGSGQQYPVQPGKSVVLASTALNHKAPFTGNNGTTISVNNPDLTVDLSGADFEVYLGNDVPQPLASDLDNPNVPNMLNILWMGTDLILDNNGREAIVLIQSDVDIRTFPRYPTPNTTTIGNNTVLRHQVPKSLVIDGVEGQPSPTNQVPKMLPNDIDAGFFYVPGGAWSSEAGIRLTANSFGDRKVLKDSNNSENDFGAKKANPRGFLD
ncbi:DUF4876 domain-containing protein [Belliella kenyensis]|uniref:DUF4876 domain-containing protein n=1 Tax=Belliella kenyensis TaxID=1472724 RepID=A0ABV8EJ06_9BACT|nr:DUF4876 domain-containing protein [Belliella kenyensis]MCH7400389.1 DUF4876 domain-containing protein [Belliella kenyensis]MDN3604593.1 DUF4876 domain-containing protein [Belliella kenyensis]